MRHKTIFSHMHDCVIDVAMYAKYIFAKFIMQKSKNCRISNSETNNLVDIYNFSSFISNGKDIAFEINSLIIEIFLNQSCDLKFYCIDKIECLVQTILATTDDDTLKNKVLEILINQAKQGVKCSSDTIAILESEIEENQYSRDNFYKKINDLLLMCIKNAQPVGDVTIKILQKQLSSPDKNERDSAFDLLNMVINNQIIEDDDIFRALEIERASRVYAESLSQEAELSAPYNFIKNNISKNHFASITTLEIIDSNLSNSLSLEILLKIAEAGQPIFSKTIEKLEKKFDFLNPDKLLSKIFIRISYNSQKNFEGFMNNLADTIVKNYKDSKFNECNNNTLAPAYTLVDLYLKIRRGIDESNEYLFNSLMFFVNNGDINLISSFIEYIKENIRILNQDQIKLCKNLLFNSFRLHDNSLLEKELSLLNEIKDYYEFEECDIDILLQKAIVNNNGKKFKKQFVKLFDHENIQSKFNSTHKEFYNYIFAENEKNCDSEENKKLNASAQSKFIMDELGVRDAKTFYTISNLIKNLYNADWSHVGIIMLLKNLSPESKSMNSAKDHLMIIKVLQIIHDYKISSNMRNEIFTILKRERSEWLSLLNELAFSENGLYNEKPQPRRTMDVISEFRNRNAEEDFLLNFKDEMLSKSINNIKNRKIVSCLSRQSMDYNGPSHIVVGNGLELFEISDEPISSWSKKDIKAWSNKVKANPKIFEKPDFIIEALAVAAQAHYIFKGQELRDTQILSLLTMLNHKGKFSTIAKRELGRILQIATGEGKSNIVAIAAAINALMGKKVDVITTTSVLAERDADSKKNFLKY